MSLAVLLLRKKPVPFVVEKAESIKEYDQRN